MISSLFGVAAAKVNSISETIQSLNPTETLENALKTAPPVSVPSSFPTPQSFNTTSQPTRAPQPTFTKPSQPSAQVAPPRNQPPIGLSNSRSSAALSNNSNFPPEESKNNQVYFSPQHTSSSSAASRNESKEAPPLPDLSGLSAEEQRKIREVLERQCDEDASEQQALTRQRGELEQLEKDVRLLGEQSRSMGMADGSVCQICFQVKFEPVSSSTPAGHRCHSCQLKFCASCGHKTQLHTHKLAWQCKICKKKADILARSGKWVSPATVNKSEQSAAPQNNATVGVNNAAGATDHSSSFSQGQGQPAHPAVSSCTASSNGPLTGGPQSNEQLKPQPGQPEVVNHRQNDPRSGHGDLIGQHNNSSGLSNQQQYNNLNSNNVNAFSSKPQQLQPGSQQQHHQQVSNNITQAHPIAAPTQTTSAAAAANSNSSSSSPFSQLAKLLPAAIQPAVLSQQASSAPHPQTSNSNPVSANSSNTRLPGPPDSNNVSAAGLLGGSGAGLLSSMGVGENAQPPPPLPPPRSSNPPHPLKGGSAAAVAGQQPPPPRRSITSSSFSHSRTGSARSSRGISNSSGNLAPPRRSPPRPPEDGGPPYSSSHGHAPHHRRSPSGRYSLGGGSAPRDPDLPDSGYRSESNRTSSSRDSLEKQRRQREHLGGREPSSQQPHQQQHHSGDKRHSAGSMHKMDSIGSEFSVPNDSGVPMYKTSAGSLHYSDLGQHPDDALAGGVGHHSYHDDPYAREAPRDHHPRDQNHLGAGAPCRTTSRHRSPPTHPRGGLDLLGAGGGRSFSSSEEDIRSTSDLTSWDGFESESLISDRGGGAGFDPWDDFNLGYSSASSRSWRGGAVEWSANADGFGSLIGRITMNKGVGRELGLKVRGGQPLDTILASCGHGLSSSLATAAASVPDKVDLEALSQQYAGVLAALVVNVRRGSPADVTAGLVAGDEILEWNKVSFRNLTHNQVTHVIMQSKQETEVELVICRRPFLQLKQLQLNSGASRGSRSVSGSATAAPVSGSSVTAAGAQLVDQVHNNSAVAAASQLPYPPRPTTRRGPTQHPSNSSGGHSDPTGVHSSVTSSAAVGVGGGSGDVMNGGAGGGSSSSNANISSSSAASALFYSLPASVYRNISAAPPPTGHFSSTGGQGHPHMQPSSECVSGQLQMQLSYNDKDSQLTVTVCQAVDLISREGGQARNPYAKIYLLPDRSEDSLRRTKTATNTLCPQWNQSFSFYVNRNSFPDKELEVTLWDNCFADQPPPPAPVTSSAAATDHFLYKGGALAVKEFLGEVLLSLDQAMLDNDLSPSSGPQWYDLHVHDSSSNHSLPIPSPPPPSMSHQQNPLSLAPPHSTARQKSAPAYDTSATAAHTSYGTSSSKFPLNSLWPNNAVDDSIGAVQIGTMDKFLKNVRNFQLPLSLNIHPTNSQPHLMHLPSPHQPPPPSGPATAPPTPSFSGLRTRIATGRSSTSNTTASSNNTLSSPFHKSNQFLSYIIHPKTPQQTTTTAPRTFLNSKDQFDLAVHRGQNGVMTHHPSMGLGATGVAGARGGFLDDGAKFSPGSRSLPNEKFGDSSSAVAGAGAPQPAGGSSVWSQPGSFFNGLLQKVADKTSSWDNNSNPVASSVGTGGGVDARMAAQALLSPQSLDRSHGGREDVFLSRKGATAPSTPMRSEMGAADYQRMNNRVSLDNSGYLSGSMDQRGPGGGGRRAHSQRDTPEFASFGGGGGARHSRGTGAGNYELWDEHRSPRSNRYTSGYHSAGEGYHYVTGSSRHSDVGDDRDDLLLYATDIEGPSAGGRHRHSRSAFDNWENRSTSRYSSRSPTYYSDVEAATGRRVLRHPGGRDQFSGGPTDHAYRSGGHGGRQHRASSSSAGRRGSGSSDHFLDQDGSFPRSLPDPRSGRGNGGAVASSRFYGGNNNRNLSSSFNVGGGATGAAGLHQSGGEVFRFRRYRGGPASRVRQYNRHGGNTHNNSILSQSAGGGGANFWSPQNLKSHATAHFTRDRMCHSDAEGDFLSDYEFERGAGSTGHGGKSLVHPFSSSNYSYRHGGTSPGSTGPSTPTQSFGFPGGGGMGMGGSGRAGGGGGGGGEEQSEHSITPRAGMFSPNEYVNDRNIPMRRQSSVQNPPVSPPPPMGRSSHGGGGEESSSSRSLRRQISDALGGYFGGGGSSDNNLQHSERGGAAADKMDDFLHTHNDLTSPHLRNQNYDRGRKQLDGGGGGEREYSRSSGGGGGGGEKLSRESCHSSGRFGGGDDCSSFDSPGSRSRSNTNKTNNSSNLYSPSSEYANENMPPPRTGKRSRESSGLNERSPRCSEQQQEQYMDNEHSHSHSSSRDRERGGGDYVQQPPPRHSSGRGSKAPPELEPPEMYDDGGSGSMDEHQNHQGRGGRSWEREYHENDMGDTTSNVSNAQHPSRGAHPGDHLPSRGAEGERGDRDRDSRGGANQQGRSHREGERQEEEEEEEEDDIELAFRRGGLESEADLRDELDEDEEDDIDNWLLAQSKKYGVKMEQVDRSEEAEHVLSASMPMGADAGFFSDSGGVGGFPGPHGAGGGVGGKKRRPSIGHKIGALVGLSKKSNSLTQLQVEKKADGSSRSSNGSKEKRCYDSQCCSSVGAPHTPRRGSVARSKGTDLDQVSVGGASVSASVSKGSNSFKTSTNSLSASLNIPKDTRNKRISIPRSAEVGFHTHDDMKQYLLSRMTADTESIASTEASLFLQSQYAMPAEKQLNSFVEDLGPGQVVGRQVLGSPCLGEIQLSIGLKRNTCLEVEIVRARNLTMRPQAKLFPAAFVKVYLMEGKKCCGKAKTKIARRTTDPYFQQQLSFDAAPSGRTLQVTVWGDYGRMERKCFMGVAQINLDALNLSNIVIGWYKLFTSSSLVEHSKNSSCSHAPGFAPSHFSDY